MRTLLRRFSLLFLIASWAGLLGLLLTDGFHRLHLTPSHQRLSALALIFVGLSYICFQIAAVRKPAERVKGILLGTAFVLWGSEQFVPPSPLVTLIDTAVIAIFVVDISLVLVERMRNPDA